MKRISRWKGGREGVGKAREGKQTEKESVREARKKIGGDTIKWRVLGR